MWAAVELKGLCVIFIFYTFLHFPKYFLNILQWVADRFYNQNDVLQNFDNIIFKTVEVFIDFIYETPLLKLGPKKVILKGKKLYSWLFFPKWFITAKSEAKYSSIMG